MEKKKMYMVYKFYNPYEVNVTKINNQLYEVDGYEDSELYRIDDNQLLFDTKEEADAYVNKKREEVDIEKLAAFINYLRGEAEDGSKEASDILNNLLPYSLRRTDDVWSKDRVKTVIRRVMFGTVSALKDNLNYSLKINDISSACHKMKNGEPSIVIIDKKGYEYSLVKDSVSRLIIETLFDI